jgi:hypothetical protein
MEPVQDETIDIEIEVKSFPFVVSKHEFNPEYAGEGNESGEGEAGEGTSEGGTN